MSVPWGTVASVGLVWLGCLLVYSLWVALTVARFAAKPWWAAVGVGLLTPVIGPWIWAAVAWQRARANGYRSSASGWRPTPAMPSSLWWAAAVLLGLSLFFPWVVVSATVESQYDQTLRVTPLDSLVGAATLGLYAVSLVVGGLYGGHAARRRHAVVLGAGATLLVAAALSSVIIYAAIGGAASTVESWTGQRLAGQLEAGPAVWMTAAAALLAAAGCGWVVATADALEAPTLTTPVGPPANHSSWGWASEQPPAQNESWNRDSTGGW